MLSSAIPTCYNWLEVVYCVRTPSIYLSFVDLDPDPQDTYVFGPPGPGSGSGSFYHQEKIVRKNWIPTVL
jgi:hypothetical protein